MLVAVLKRHTRFFFFSFPTSAASSSLVLSPNTRVAVSSVSNPSELMQLPLEPELFFFFSFKHCIEGRQADVQSDGFFGV